MHAVSPLSYRDASSAGQEVDELRASGDVPPALGSAAAAAASGAAARATPTGALRGPINSVEFSYSALEAMAMLRQRIASPVAAAATDKTANDSVPLDLSESSNHRTDETKEVVAKEEPSTITAVTAPSAVAPMMAPPEPTSSEEVQSVTSWMPWGLGNAPPTTHPQDPIRSVLDARAERWRLKKERRRRTDTNHQKRPLDNTPSDAEELDDLDEEVSRLSLGLTQKARSPPLGGKAVDARRRRADATSAKQLRFLGLFGLTTPQQSSGIHIFRFIVNRFCHAQQPSIASETW